MLLNLLNVAQEAEVEAGTVNWWLVVIVLLIVLLALMILYYAQRIR